MKDTNVSLASQCMSHIFQAVDDHNKAFTFTADYQLITNPAYNRDRGPVSVFGARLRAQF